MKYAMGFLLLAVMVSTARAESFGYGRGNGQQGFSRQQGGPGNLTQQQRQGMEACLQAAGIQPPQRPQLTTEQQAAAESCRGQSSNPESFFSCMSAAGIQPPPRPQLSDSQRKALEACRQKVGAN